MKPIVAVTFGLLALILISGFVWLATAPVPPPAQKVEQVIPDDHIPR